MRRCHTTPCLEKVQLAIETSLGCLGGETTCFRFMGGGKRRTSHAVSASHRLEGGDANWVLLDRLLVLLVVRFHAQHHQEVTGLQRRIQGVQSHCRGGHIERELPQGGPIPLTQQLWGVGVRRLEDADLRQ
jgi:hypothetical protein